MTEFKARLARAWPPERWQDVTVILAVSGGPDSVALARAMAGLRRPQGARLVLAHYNHGLRGVESAADEQFVVELARQLECDARVGRANPQAPGMVKHDADLSVDGGLRGDAGGSTLPGHPTAVAAQSGTSEELLRSARYDFLLATAQDIGARYVVTAHTADDQSETVLHRIVRGTGLAGLAGIGHARELAPGIALVRPLLALSRQDVLAYLAELGQSFRVDRSNQDCSYTRNRLRNELLPHLAATYNPRIQEALLRLACLAAEAQAALAPQVSELAAQAAIAIEPSRLVLDAPVLAAASRFLAREALAHLWRAQGWPLQAMGYEEWNLLVELTTGEPAQPIKRVLPGGIVAECTDGRLLLSPAGAQAAKSG